MSESKTRIGIFDSGIGGLTVLKQIQDANLYDEVIYLGDTGRVPYGTKSRDTIIEYAEQDIRFLVSQGVEKIVIACGTVSTNALSILKENFDIPIYGIVESSVQEAIHKTKTGKIGVIGTKATVNSKAFATEIHRYDKNIEVYEQECSLFVPLIEYGFHINGKYLIEQTCEFYLNHLKASHIDTLILGCTHYPIIKDCIANFLPDIEIIDVGEALTTNLLAKDSCRPCHTNVSYYVTDDPALFIINARSFYREILPCEVKRIDLSTY